VTASMEKALLRSAIVVLAAWTMLIGSGLVVEAPASEPPKGAERIVIPGGVTGDVAFPHLSHQQNLENCDICHSLYPEEADVIDRFKEQGKLKPKAVMNQQCTACHREKKRSGLKAGPTTCKGCHRKD